MTTFFELFAGAGGLSMGLERAGMRCVGHAEIADAPRAVLAHRWPEVPLFRDVMTLDGADLLAACGPIDLLTGGSPCQDLSVAGKRRGLVGARSSLFYQQMRLWDETGADLCLWENVDGARSSNGGQDFGFVLGAFVGAPVPVPSDGWRSAGVAAGPRGIAAWRVLDAQFFGVPQRRRRVFILGTRTGSLDPAEVLSLGESLRGDLAPRREAGEGTPARIGGGVAVPLLEIGKRTGVSTTDPRAGSGIGSDGDPMFTLQASAQHGVLAFDWQNSPSMGMECRRESSDSLRTSAVPAVLAFDALNSAASDTAHTLRSNMGQASGWGAVLTVTGEGVTHALTHEGVDASEDGTGRGTPAIVARCVTAGEGQRNDWETCTIIAQDAACPVADSLTVGANQTTGIRAGGEVVASLGIPRRLTPRECERLMGWEDDHTLVPYRGKPMSDAARYKMCGNGVASVVTHWIGLRIVDALAYRRGQELAA